MTYPSSSGDWQDPTRPLSGLPDDSQQPGQQSAPSAPANDQPGLGQPGLGQPAGGVPHPPTGPYPGAYPPGAYPPGPYPQPGHPGYGYLHSQTNSLAIPALVLSLVGVMFCITAPVGAILGHVAQKQIRETGESGEGMAKAAIIVGWILTGLGALAIAFYVVFIAIAIGGSTV